MELLLVMGAVTNKRERLVPRMSRQMKIVPQKAEVSSSKKLMLPIKIRAKRNRKSQKRKLTATMPTRLLRVCESGSAI